MSFFTRRKTEDPRDTRIRFLEEENEALVASAAAMRKSAKDEHERQQRRIDTLVDEKHRLRIQADAYQRALKLTQAERDKAIAEVKRLDAELVKVAT